MSLFQEIVRGFLRGAAQELGIEQYEPVPISPPRERYTRPSRTSMEKYLSRKGLISALKRFDIELKGETYHVSYVWIRSASYTVIYHHKRRKHARMRVLRILNGKASIRQVHEELWFAVKEREHRSAKAVALYGIRQHRRENEVLQRFSG